MIRKAMLLLGGILAIYQFGISQSNCSPNENGHFEYYATLNVPEVAEDFSIQDFFTLIEPHTEAAVFDTLQESIQVVEKAFPTAVTPSLQVTVAIYASTQDLEYYLNDISAAIQLAEIVCYPEGWLLYEPNDYTILTVDANTHLDLINADKAWDICQGDPRIKIGITDTYIEEDHEDLRYQIDSIVRNSNIVDYHGTGIAGMAAGRTDNQLGLASIGFKSKIVFSSRLYWSSEVLKIAQIPGVRVINISWTNGCTYPGSIREAVYDEIVNVHNVVVVAGAGNHPKNDCNLRTDYSYPASFESVISVTSVGHIAEYGYNDPIYGNYNWKDCHEEVLGDPNSAHFHNDKVDICAPGYALLTLTNGNSYDRIGWGTSYAAPLVAGTCALIAALNPCLSAVEIKDIVLQSADPSIYQLPCNSPYIGLLGKGRLDAYAALQLALQKDRRYIQNQVYTGPVTLIEDSETELYAGENVQPNNPTGPVRIKTGADVKFKATSSVVLSNGFEVENLSNFEIDIIESTCF